MKLILKPEDPPEIMLTLSPAITYHTNIELSSFQDIFIAISNMVVIRPLDIMGMFLTNPPSE
jgi:hypothetical protein